MTAALNKFISRSTDKCKPLFQLLHKWKGFERTQECDVAFEGLKEYLSYPPILSRLGKEEVRFTYKAVTSYTVSLVLVRMKAEVQRPIYYVSKSLQEAEVRYLPLKKAILAIMHATRKFPHHFHAHTVVVLTQLPLQSLL